MRLEVGGWRLESVEGWRLASSGGGFECVAESQVKACQLKVWGLREG